MTDAVRWGLLSTARINQALIAGIRGRGRAPSSSPWPRATRARGAAYAAEHGIPRAHGSYEALLADPEVDAVYVSLPNALHVPWSVAGAARPASTCCARSR